jgi:uncharacterized membrane protein YeaQ/YmgE (transglycosylase-associated protein family)
MGFITWIVLGGISGWIVSMLVKTNAEQGLIGNIVVGSVGAVIGGFLGSELLGYEVTGFNLSSIALAVLGGLVFVFIWKAVTGKKTV